MILPHEEEFMRESPSLRIGNRINYYNIYQKKKNFVFDTINACREFLYYVWSQFSIKIKNLEINRIRIKRHYYNHVLLNPMTPLVISIRLFIIY